MSSKRKQRDERIPQLKHSYFLSGHFRVGFGFRAKIRVGLSRNVRKGMVWEWIQSMKFLRSLQQEYKCVCVRMLTCTCLWGPLLSRTIAVCLHSQTEVIETLLTLLPASSEQQWELKCEGGVGGMREQTALQYLSALAAFSQRWTPMTRDVLPFSWLLEETETCFT